MNNPLHTQNEIESDWNKIKSSNGGTANSRCSDSAGSVPSVGSEYITLLETMVANIDPLDYPEDSLEAAVMRKNHRKYYPDNY